MPGGAGTVLPVDSDPDEAGPLGSLRDEGGRGRRGRAGLAHVGQGPMGGGKKVPEQYRSRRSCLAVPGSSQRFLDKARGLAADEVFLDLEDAVAPAAKEAARRNVIAALNAGGWGGKLVAVRVNDATTRWAYRDVTEVVAAAGRGLDAIILPKVTDPGHVVWLDLMLGQIEQDTGDEPGRIGIEAQIEDARGLGKGDA